MMYSKVAFISAASAILGTVVAGQNDLSHDPMRLFVEDRVARRRLFESNAPECRSQRRRLAHDLQSKCVRERIVELEVWIKKVNSFFSNVGLVEDLQKKEQNKIGDADNAVESKWTNFRAKFLPQPEKITEDNIKKSYQSIYGYGETVGFQYCWKQDDQSFEWSLQLHTNTGEHVDDTNLNLQVLQEWHNACQTATDSKDQWKWVRHAFRWEKVLYTEAMPRENSEKNKRWGHRKACSELASLVESLSPTAPDTENALNEAAPSSASLPKKKSCWDSICSWFSSWWTYLFEEEEDIIAKRYPDLLGRKGPKRIDNRGLFN